jgi:hypothetical protein
MDNNDPTGCGMYACVGQFGNPTTGGLAFYNLCENTQPNYISFESVANSETGQFLNDLVIEDSDEAYVTDSLGMKVKLVCFKKSE